MKKERKEYVTTTEASILLGWVSPSTVLRAAKAGILKGYRTPGGHFRLEMESVGKLMRASGILGGRKNRAR